MGEFPSGQRGQTVNLLRIASMVRIRPPPPQKRHTFRCVFFVLLGDGFENRMQQSGGLLLAAGLDGGNTLFFLFLTEKKNVNESVLPCWYSVATAMARP